MISIVAHRETSAVDHAADRAIQLDIIEVVLRRLQLRRILFILVPQRLDILVADTRRCRRSSSWRPAR